MGLLRYSQKQRGLASKPLLLGVASLGLVICGVGAWWLLLPKTPEEIMEDHAAEYVELALSLAWHRELEVDSYIGPAALDIREVNSMASISDLQLSVSALLEKVDANVSFPDTQRLQKFKAKLERFDALLSTIINPDSLKFEEELATIYELSPGQDLEVPAVPDDESLSALNELLPGRGTLSFRVAAFRNQLIIPADKRRMVFEAALKECRSRTLKHWQLPNSESLEIEWSRDVGAAWHQYNGNYSSTLKINDLSIGYLNTAIDVACHEAYPGHHAQYAMMESAKPAGGFNVEDAVYLLRTPSSVIREGAANLGVELIFPLAERLEFERSVLAPIAGISIPAEEKYTEFLSLLGKLSKSITPILRDYLTGELSFNTASIRLEREALVSSPNELLRFADEFGAYSVGYQLVQERLAEYLLGSDDAWAALLEIIVDNDTRF